jgi:Ca2+-binding RTX toxin-like protein
MTVISPGVGRIDTGVLIDLGAAGDDAVIRNTVTLVSTDDTVIEGSGSGHVVTVAGTVRSQDGSGVALGNLAAGASGNRLVVTETGEVSGAFSTLSAGALILGSGLVLDNAGKIFGTIGVGFGVEAAKTAVLDNSGTIFAALGVTRIDGLGVARLINTGVIEGQGTAYAGEFLGGPLVARDIVINSGVMRGDISLGSGNDLYVARSGGRVVGTIDGGIGDDTFRLGIRAETVSGGPGNDILDFRNAGPVQIALDGAFTNTGFARGDTYLGIDQVWGSNQADRIRGTAAPETLSGNGGNDTLIGGDGFNFLIGGKGQDRVVCGADTDIIQFNGPQDLGDRIVGFDPAEDVIHMPSGKFPGLGGGFGPTAGQFRTRTDNLAQDGNDRFIFRTTDATLWYDKDGAGGTGSVLVADFDGGVILTYGDIDYVLL